MDKKTVFWLICIIFGGVSALFGGNWEVWSAASFVVISTDE